MQFYYIEPEVSGGFGDETEGDFTSHPPLIRKLHYEFDGWLGDDLIESFPCYIVSARLLQLMESNGLSGFDIDDVKTSISHQFKELYPDKVLPEFYWLKVIGKAGKEDFGIAKDLRLVVSSKALEILNSNTLDQADIEEV